MSRTTYLVYVSEGQWPVDRYNFIECHADRKSAKEAMERHDAMDHRYAFAMTIKPGQMVELEGADKDGFLKTRKIGR